MARASVQTSAPLYQKAAAQLEAVPTNHALWTSTLAWRLRGTMTSAKTSHHCVPTLLSSAHIQNSREQYVINPHRICSFAMLLDLTLKAFAETGIVSQTILSGRLQLARSVNSIANESVMKIQQKWFAMTVKTWWLASAHFSLQVSRPIQTNVILTATNSTVVQQTGRLVLLNRTGTSVRVTLSYATQMKSYSWCITVTSNIIINQASKTNMICSGESAVTILPSTVQMEIRIHLLSEMSVQTGVLHCSPHNINKRLCSQVSGLSAEPILWESAKLIQIFRTPSAIMAGP